MSIVVAVVGTIAGAGTTTAVSALGTALGEQRQRVALVDATEEGSRIDDVLETEGGGDLTDALRRGTAVGDVQATGPHDVAAFPAASDTSWGAVRPDAVDALYGELRDRFDVVLVDVGSTLTPASAPWLGHADEAVIVTDPDVAGAVPETVALADAFDVSVRGALANRVRLKKVSDALDALADTGQPVLGVFPEDPTVGAAGESETSVFRTEPDSPVATVAWELALCFRDGDHEEPVVPTGTGPATSDDGESDDASADSAAPPTSDSSAGSGDEEQRDEPAAAGAGVTGGERPGDEKAGDEEAGSEGADGEVTEPGSAGAGAADTDTEDAESVSTTAEPAAESGESAGRPAPSSGAAESDAPADEDDPFTAADPQPADGSEDGTEGEGDAQSSVAQAEDDGSEDPLGSLLGDVRNRVEDAGADDTPSWSDDAAEAKSEGGTDASIGTSAGLQEDTDSGDEDSAELSDDEIEAVFKETMQRVQQRREAKEEAEGEAEDS